MHWLFRQLTDRDSGWWRFYESASAPFGCFTLIILLLYLWNGVAPQLGQPLILSPVSDYFFPLMISFISWILFGDKIKYRLTKDPRDEPRRKWFSFKNAQKFLSHEVVILEDNNVVRSAPETTQLIKSLAVTQCPKCDVMHAFGANETNPRTCVFYGCGESVSPNKPSNKKEDG